MNNGDIVANKINGIVGKVIKKYRPTASEEQIMVETLDGRKYHAPVSDWVKLVISVNNESELIIGIKDEVNIPYLNAYGEYVVKFAKNHGLTIDQAYREPMVKARYEFFQKTGL